jgi:hypothetical protein
MNPRLMQKRENTRSEDTANFSSIASTKSRGSKHVHFSISEDEWDRGVSPRFPVLRQPGDSGYSIPSLKDPIMLPSFASRIATALQEASDEEDATTSQPASEPEDRSRPLSPESFQRASLREAVGEEGIMARPTGKATDPRTSNSVEAGEHVLESKRDLRGLSDAVVKWRSRIWSKDSTDNDFLYDDNGDQVAVIPSREVPIGLQFPSKSLLTRELLYLRMKILTFA